MRSVRGSRVLAWTLFGVAIAAIAVSFVLLLLALDAPEPTGAFGFRGFSSIYGLAFAVIGLLITLRRPRNPAGWMMLAAGGVLAGLQQCALQYATWTILGDGTGGSGDVAAWLQDWIWLPQFATLGMMLVLIPDGHLPSPRWRPLPWLLSVAVAIAAVTRMTMPGVVESFREAVNPFGLETAGDALEVIYAVAMTIAIAGVALCAASLVVRSRGASGETRAQVRWVAFGGSLAVGVFTVYLVVYGLINTGLAVDLLEIAFVVSVIAFAACVGIAILRLRLFDIEVVVTKTVVFGVLATFITAVYVGFVVGIGALVGTRGDVLLSAVAAALVAMAFQPVRRRAQRFANRLVYGERASPYEVLSSFSQRVASAYAADDVLERMARLLGEGTGASRAEVWVRVGRRLQRSAAWPAADAPVSVALADGELPSIEGASLAVPVRDEGHLLGALVLAKPPSDPVSPTEERLVEDLAHQAGLVLRNAALIAELRASRQRLVSAQDEERRRLERNLHDGAQQQLVALTVNLGLLKRLGGDALPVPADELIDRLRADSQDALENLRDLARGIYPPLLADRGLREALEAQGRKAALPVEVLAGSARYPQEIEAAVYFSCLEALQNVAKYARASVARVRIREDRDALVFEVEDDGVGFDAETETGGTGLQGIRDRLAALGGSLAVLSAPGAGTVVTGTIPLGYALGVERTS